MAVNTRIQFRRGTATEWANAANTLGQGILYQGELGFETNTGKFKIGNGTLHWNNLPYAGGSQIVAQTGVGYYSDTSNNTYTLYSVITGVTGGQDGITFQTFPLSGLLNDPTVSGTYYRIGLSNKLENFHDSNLSIESNTIYSTTSGITVSGFNNSTISLNPGGGTVTQSGVDIRNLTEAITVTSGIGGLSTGTQLTNASGITAILKQMLQQVFEPTLVSGPSVSFSSWGGVTNPSEIGTTGNLTLTVSYNAGRINGTGIGAGWNSTAQQGNRAGSVTAYIISGVNNGASASRTFNNFQLNAASISVPFSANYASGITAVNSIGAVSTSISPNPLPSGTTADSTASITSYRGIFYGWNKADNNIPSSSSDIRNLNQNTSNISGTMVNATAPYTFTLTIPSGTKKIIVAFPSGVQSFTNSQPVGYSQPGIKAINASQNPETYSATIINVSGANNFTAIPYYVKYYIPAGPIDGDTNHTITIT